MLNFLRKLRRNNMSSKYLKYAVGEIVLVVIGILIALSINNWNEKRKDQAIEDQIISEMLNSLKSDSTRFHFLLHRVHEKDSAIQVLNDLKESGTKPTSEQTERLFEMGSRAIAFNYDVGPYQALVSLGINKMSNKDLLKDIIHYYNVRLPRTEQFIKGADEEFGLRIGEVMNMGFDDHVLSKTVVKNNEGRWITTWKNHTDKILESNYFKEFTIVQLEYAERLSERLRPIIRDNAILIQKLKYYRNAQLLTQNQAESIEQ